MSEARENRIPIGTTSRGIGPCYEDKIGRRGIRIADLYDPDSFRELYDTLAEDKQTLADTFKLEGPIDYTAIRARRKHWRNASVRWFAIQRSCSPMRWQHGKRMLFEGAQGTMLDIDHGTYPFVTSSSAAAGGACTGTGGSAHANSGRDRRFESLHHARRYGAVSHREQRCRRRSAAPRRKGIRMRSPAVLAAAAGSMCRCCAIPPWSMASIRLFITKLDVLDQLDEIPVCVGYRLDGEEVDGNACHLPGARSASSRCMKAARLADVDPRDHALRRSPEKAPKRI